MRQILLVRHGDAENRSTSGRDEDRALTTRGRRELVAIGRALDAMGARPCAVWTSPLRRAVETGQILASALGAKPRVEPALAPGGSESVIASQLNGEVARESVMLVGHLPDIGELASYLLVGDRSEVGLDFGKASVACLEGAAVPPLGRLVLRWFLRAPELTALGQR